MSTENDARATQLPEKATATLEQADQGGTEWATLMQHHSHIEAVLSISYQLAALTEAVDALRWER